MNIHFAAKRIQWVRLSRTGLTLIEMVVVLGCIGILLALLMPAIMSTRRSVSETQCAANLHEIGVAIQRHVNTHRHFPTNGWGFGWVGENDGGFGTEQPGGWIYNLAPYMDPRDQRIIAVPDRSENTGSVFGWLICPGRRQPIPYPVNLSDSGFEMINTELPAVGGKSDYAICGGDSVIDGWVGPADRSGSAWDPVLVSKFAKFSGVSFIRSTVRPAEVTDGLSFTVCVGEKALGGDPFAGTSLGDDQFWSIGDDADQRRWTAVPPLPDSPKFDDIQSFGGPHRGGVQTLFCDGSVRTISFTVDGDLYRAAGNRSDGKVLTEF